MRKQSIKQVLGFLLLLVGCGLLEGVGLNLLPVQLIYPCLGGLVVLWGVLGLGLWWCRWQKKPSSLWLNALFRFVSAAVLGLFLLLFALGWVMQGG